MANRNSLLKTTFAGGVMFLVPLVVLGVIIDKALGIVRQVVAPLAEHLPVESLFGLKMPWLLGTVLILAFCLIAGLFARTTVAKRFIGWLESAILGNLPGYVLMKSLGDEMAGAEGSEPRPVVLARIEDAWQLAFLVERIEGGHVAVFVPDAPSPWSGSLYFMTEDRIRPLTVPVKDALKCIRRVGIGANELLRSHIL